MDTQNNTGEGSGTNNNQTLPTEGQNPKLMAALSYVGPLVIVSYLISKDNPFVKFHIKQGAVLFVIEAAAWFIGMTLWMLWPISSIVSLAAFVLSIVGIVNVVNSQEKILPVVGKYADYVRI